MSRSQLNDYGLRQFVTSPVAQCSLAALVVAVHRGFESVRGDRLDRVRRAIEERRHRLSFGSSHRTQQVVLVFLGLRLAAGLHLDCEAGRTPDSNSDANEVGCSERLCDRTDAAIAGVASTLLHSEPARFEIELVMQHNQMTGGNFEISEQVGNTFAA